jgi:hypothetical protein
MRSDRYLGSKPFSTSGFPSFGFTPSAGLTSSPQRGSEGRARPVARPGRGGRAKRRPDEGVRCSFKVPPAGLWLDISEAGHD